MDIAARLNRPPYHFPLMSILSYFDAYLRNVANIPAYVRSPLDLEVAVARQKDFIQRREEIFMGNLAREVFEIPRSPYLFLFKEAGCEAGDVARLLRENGLDQTLEVLSDAGVYVTFDQFKGRAPIERNGRVLEVSDTDFDNPLVRGAGSRTTSGSSGRATKLKTDWRAKGRGSYGLLISMWAYGVNGAPTARYNDMNAAAWGVGALTDVVGGHGAKRWFRTIPLHELQGGRRGRIGVEGIRFVSRILGQRLAGPEFATPLEVALWIREQVDAHGSCILQTPVSYAVRVAAAANENGLDLGGAVIVSGGEPATAAKARIVRGSGARWAVNYVVSEAGYIGMACPKAEDPTDVHQDRSGTALIQRPYKIGITGESVPAFRITTFRLVRSKVLINVEMDDFGIMEERECGCRLQEIGFTPHLRQIFSHSKLTGEGVTLVGGWTTHILEEVLPSRFGGTPLDYQLIEHEAESGQTQVTIAVSPRLGPLDESEVVRCFLDGLSDLDRYLERAMWESAGTLRVARQEPIAGSTGKVLPLYRTRKTPR